MNTDSGTLRLNLSHPALRQLFPHVFMLTLAGGIGIALHRTAATASLFETLSVTIMLAILQYCLLANVRGREWLASIASMMTAIRNLREDVNSTTSLLVTQGQVKDLADPCFQYVADRSLMTASGPTCDVSPQGVTLTPSGAVFEAYKFFWEYFLHQPQTPKTIYCVHSTPIHIWNQRDDFLEIQGVFPKGTITRIVVGEPESFESDLDPYILAIKSMLKTGACIYYVTFDQIKEVDSKRLIHDFAWVEDSRHMFQWTKGDDGVTISGAEIRTQIQLPATWKFLIEEVFTYHELTPMTEPEDYRYLPITRADSEATAE